MKTKLFFFVLFLLNTGILLAQLPASLYIVGSAAPTGWHIDNALKLETISSGVYKYSGPLFAGSYKFANNQDTCWCQDFYVRDGSDPTKVILNGEDNQWNISTLAQYDVTVNLNAMTINVQQTSALPSYTHFWLIGDASPAGWNMDNVIEQKFSVNPGNPSEYYYQGNLTAGDFKIFMGNFNEFCGSFYMPLTNYQDLNNTAAQIVTNCALDYKWKIQSEDQYSIVINTENNTVTVTPGVFLAANQTVAKKDFSVYPNPSKGTLYIRSDKSFDNASAEIYTLEGRIMKSLKITDNKLSTHGLKSGIYFLKVKNGSETYSSKIIVE